MEKEINILCASDRFNYGDLIFPHIVIGEMQRLGDYSFRNVAIVKSDLSKYEALPTLNYKSLYKKDKQEKSRFLFVAGGEVLGAKWGKLYSFIYKWFYLLYKYFPRPMYLELLIRYITGNKNNPIPFTPLSPRLTSTYRVIYNAVGGCGIHKHSLSKQIQDSFLEALYVSVREENTFDSIHNKLNVESAVLAPDSAMLMPEYFRIEEKKDEKYIVFQVGHQKNGGSLNLLKTQIESICEKTKLPVYLLPIGNCPGHDDKISLEWLHKNLECPNKLIAPLNVTTIMSCIANSEMFIGTSLHGVITAMSFNVPYMGINEGIGKLKYYLNTWAPDPLKAIVPINKIQEKVIEYFSVDRSILIKCSEEQKEQVRNSFCKIHSLINDI